VAVVNVRELARRTSRVLASVQTTKRPTLITRGGRPIAAAIPVDPELLEDWVLANAPQFVQAMVEGDRELREGGTVSFEAYLASRRQRRDRGQPRRR
jgi:prevent-host-death family protein